MGRHKIDYGIDLGTTNSAIARMENGLPKVKKSDDKQMDTTPSCVSFDKKQTIWVGEKAYNRLNKDLTDAFMEFTRTGKISEINTFNEFKREMGTDNKHSSPHMGKDYTPEELSAEVLKKLKSYVRDEEVSAAVITIPMRFGQHQVDATRRAAELAGFQYIETLQEPIAASIAYGLESKKTQGFWFVFDLGGGTFDAALLRVVDGIMKVEDSAGDTRLGGRDIDYAIVDNIFIPYLAKQYKIDKILSTDQGRLSLRDALKWVAEEAKIINLSKELDYNVVVDEPIGIDGNGKEMELDIKVTLDDYKDVVEPIYQRAIDISKDLIQKHNLKGTDLEAVILVGGPTYCQTLRKMLNEQLSPNIDASVDLMTCVAQGAALYASAKDIPITLQKIDKTKIQLTLHYPGTTVETEEKLGIKIERSQTIGDVPQRIFAEVTRTDKGWSSGKIEIKDDAEFVPLPLNTGEANGFLITLFDEKGNIYPCEPSNITIIQGLKAAQQIIPYDLCIDAALLEMGKQRLVKLKGLEKNVTLPAKGKRSFKTQIDIRPGNAKDIIRIPIYGGDPNSNAIFNNPIGIIILTGEDFDKFLPKDSEVEITLHVDSTQYIKLSAYFPYIDETVEVEKVLTSWTQEKFDPKDIERELSNAGDKLNTLEEEYGFTEKDNIEKLQKEVSDLTTIFANGRGSDDDERKVKERLRDVFKALDKMEEETEIPKAKEKLGEAMNSLLTTNHRYGNNDTTRIVEEMQKKTKLAMDEKKDLRIIQDLNDHIMGFEFWGILWEDLGFIVSGIKHYDDSFSSIQWKNSTIAKKLINDAKQNIATNPSKKELQNILRKIYDLLPEGSERYREPIDYTILRGYLD